MEKIISVKQGKVTEKEGKEWIELVDQEDHTHRVFPSMLGNDGVWVHLDEKVSMLKGYIETGTIEGKSFKLIKEKKGTFWNVIGVEEVKNIFKQQAIKEVQDQAIDDRQVSIEGQVGLKLLHDWQIAGTLPEEHKKLGELYWLKLYDMMNKFVYGGKVEKKQSAPQNEPDKKTEVSEEVPTDEGSQERDERLARMREYVITLGWVKANKPKFNAYIKNNFLKASVDELTDAELTTLESALKEMAELK